MLAVDYFRALADETRLRCIVLIARHREVCVCELTHALGLAQPKVSRHLGILKNAALVQDHREGVWIYYSLRADLPEWAMRMLEHTVAGAQDRLPFSKDHQMLLNMPNRPLARVAATGP